MIAVSFLKSKYERGETLQKIMASDADLIHVDLLDGIYAGENNLQIDELVKELANTEKKLDIHLMVKEPLEYIKQLINLNIWAITFHLDATSNPKEIIEYVKSHNIKVGIAINPDEDIHILDKYFDLIHYVLIMSVYPGKGGQAFLEDSVSRLKKLKKMIGKRKIEITIDGGINDETKTKAKQADILVSGSYDLNDLDFQHQIDTLL